MQAVYPCFQARLEKNIKLIFMHLRFLNGYHMDLLFTGCLQELPCVGGTSSVEIPPTDVQVAFLAASWSWVRLHISTTQKEKEEPNCEGK